MATSNSSWLVAACAISCSATMLYKYHSRTLRRIESKLTNEKQAERTGRIRAEVKLRTASKSESEGSMYLKRIGTIVSPFTKRMGTPRQGALVPSARGFLKVEIPMETLDGIEHYSHAWIIFEFHANTDLSGSRKTKVKPPRAGIKVGQLATRSPHRPNSLGLSLVKIERLDNRNRQLHISAFDLVHGTPVFDVKPCVPWDVPHQLKVPDWVDRDDSLSSVSFKESAEQDLARMLDMDLLAPLYTSANEGLAASAATLSEILAQDPRASNKRGTSTQGDEPTYKIIFCRVQVEFRVAAGCVTITSVSQAKLDSNEYIDGIPLTMKG